VAGNGTNGFAGDGGAATSAELSIPWGIAVDKSGNIYIADEVNVRVRMVSASGTITTVAGDGTGGYTGDGSAATSAELSYDAAVAVDSSGNVYVADSNNQVVRKFAVGGTITTVAGSNSSGAGFSGDGAAATSAQLNLPMGLALDSAGNLYIADSNNNVIRKVATSGTITTVAGNTLVGYLGDGGLATNAILQDPRAVTLDAAGNLYIADSLNHVVRKVTGDGRIATIAGIGGQGGFSGDGGPATQAELYYPDGLAVDSVGNLYIADSLNNRIRVVTPGGIIMTVAGNGKFGDSGDGGPATSARLNGPTSVALDSAGNLYVGDSENSVVRKLTPDNSGIPSLQPGTVIGASGFGAFTSTAPGSWIEIYGSSLANDTRQWKASDFKGANAPTSLDGTSVTIGGQAAFIAYISPTQVNAQVPSNVGTGPQPVVVFDGGGASAPYSINVNATEPGLWAPPSFQIGGKAYAGALFIDFTTFVLPAGAIAGATSRPAKPGDTIVLYGIGFGPVTPAVAAGEVTGEGNALTTPLQIFLGGVAAQVTYAGLAPDAVGLYQFNVVVPNIAANDATPLTFALGGVPGQQTLYVAVGN
jgi:uncharacterized protein (TIGR03437 family)